MVMSPQEGRFVIARGGTIRHEPGGGHIMFMNVEDPVSPGETVDLTLAFQGGSAMDVAPRANRPRTGSP
ncbi:copper chaperone PCu(A)C [Promicromonospora sp. NPDC090134]|uniref:copper chaperone PCu(A)C n=1 Tax=Promicromonospora sp. NPDC090134 TaxID=3364408 RepID=UPI003800EE93